MTKLIISLCVVCVLLVATSASAQWTAEGQDPQLWPYSDTDTLPGDQNATLPGLQWNVWGSFMVAADGKVWSWGGWGTTYVRPEGDTYFDNRQSKLSYFTPGVGWVGAYGGTLSGGGATGPVGFSNGSGSALPTVGHGTSASFSPTSVASWVVTDPDATTEDPLDELGDVKIASCGGYPRWEAPMDIYNVTKDYWYAAGGNPEASLDIYANGVQIGDKYYHLDGDGVAYDYTVFDLVTESWSEGNLNSGLVDSDSWGCTGAGNIAITNDEGSYSWQDFDTDTTTAFTNNPTTSDGSAEGVVWGDWFIQISHLGNVEVYDLTQGPTGVWIVTGIGPPVAGLSGNGACVIGDTLYWSLHGTLGTDSEKGMLYSLDLSTATIPEPGVMALFGFGMLSVFALRGRRR